VEKPVENHNNGAPSPRHQENLQDILDKSSRLMAEVGFHGTTMRDLARATGRSLAGLYHYFQSKEDLLFLINFHGFTELNESWDKVVQHLETPEEKLYGFISLHTRYYVANIDDMRVMNWGTQALNYERAMTIRELKDRHTDDARELVRDAHLTITGKAADERRLERLTYLLFGMMNWIFGWYSRDDHGDVDALVGDIYFTLVNGINGGVDGTDAETLAAATAQALAQSGAPGLRNDSLAQS